MLSIIADMQNFGMKHNHAKTDGNFYDIASIALRGLSAEKSNWIVFSRAL